MAGFFPRVHSEVAARLVALFRSSSCWSRTYICMAFSVHKGPVTFSGELSVAILSGISVAAGKVRYFPTW